MGLDLILLVLHNAEAISKKDVGLYDILRFERDYDIFGQLTDCENGVKQTVVAQKTPLQFSIYFFHGRSGNVTKKDGYGEKLTYIYAEDLKKLKIPVGADPRNKAIAAYIAELQDEIPIVLYWF